MLKTYSALLTATAAAALALTSASASAADLAGTATPALTPIQLSTPSQPTFAQYDVVVTNPGAANINGWRFVARTSVLNGSSVATFYAPGSDTRCAQGSGATEVVCTFATLASGQSAAFSVSFNAPSDGSEIDLSWRAFWDESGNGGNDGFRSAQATQLAPPDANNVSSVVPKASTALTFFTGVSGVATPVDTWATVVSVPANLAQSTTANVSELVVPGGCASNLLTCATSTLSLPGSFGLPGTGASGSFAGLQITLRRDASTIANGAKIDSAVILYDAPAHPSLAVAYPLNVPSCSDTTYGALPQPGIPCEDRTKRKAYPKKSTPKASVPAGFEGDWEFVIYAVDNGRYTN